MSDSKMICSVEETLRIQTVKLNQQLNKLLEQNTQIIELTAERDNALTQNAEMVAMVEAVRMMIYNLVHACKNNSGYEPSLSVYYKAIDDAYAAWNAAPTQHLRDRDAEVVERAIELYTHKFGDDDSLNEVGMNIIRRFREYIHPEGLREYAKQLRSGEADQYAEKVRRGEV